jgi:CxxC motif-containing protein (DUF1111 family)
MGLLEAIPDATMIALAEREPNDGIRGKTNVAWDMIAGKAAVGRFGLKANQPTLRQQVAAAFIGLPGGRQRVAHAAAVGIGAIGESERPRRAAARWPRA